MARSRTKLDIDYYGERRPDAIEPVVVDGHRVITYTFGSDEEQFFALAAVLGCLAITFATVIARSQTPDIG